MHHEVVHHWWNRTWGRLNRRDVYVRTDGHAFEVEVRLGGSEGKRWRVEHPTLAAAVAEAGLHLGDDQDWVDIVAAHRARR